jgi:hypothetical protein
MTPKRKQALQWFHDRGQVPCKVAQDEMPMKIHMVRRMLEDQQLDAYTFKKVYHYALTDEGRRALNDG